MNCRKSGSDEELTIRTTLEDIRLHQHIAILGSSVRVTPEHLRNVLLAGSESTSGDHDAEIEICSLSKNENRDRLDRGGKGAV